MSWRKVLFVLWEDIFVCRFCDHSLYFWYLFVKIRYYLVQSLRKKLKIAFSNPFAPLVFTSSGPQLKDGFLKSIQVNSIRCTSGDMTHYKFVMCRYTTVSLLCKIKFPQTPAGCLRWQNAPDSLSDFLYMYARDKVKLVGQAQ